MVMQDLANKVDFAYSEKHVFIHFSRPLLTFLLPTITIIPQGNIPVNTYRPFFHKIFRNFHFSPPALTISKKFSFPAKKGVKILKICNKRVMQEEKV